MLKPVCLFITLFRKNSFAQKYAEYRIFCKTKHQGCFKIGTYLKKRLACFPSGQFFSDLNSTNRCVGRYNIIFFLYFQFFCRLKKLTNKHISSKRIQAKKSNCDRQNQEGIPSIPIT